MSMIIRQLHGVDTWELTKNFTVITGSADEVLRQVADGLGCKVSVTEQRVTTYKAEHDHYAGEVIRGVFHKAPPQPDCDACLIAERNADGRHPIDLAL